MVLAGCQGTPPGLEADREALIGGTPALSARPEVVHFVGSGWCTASMLSPTTFLTAAHCIDKKWLWRGNGAVVSTANVYSEIDKVFSQGLRGSESSNPDDIAVGSLTTPVTGIVPATIATTMPFEGNTLTEFGYGCLTSPSENCTPEVRSYVQYTFTGGHTGFGVHGDSGGPTFIGRVGDNGPIMKILSGYRTDIFGNNYYNVHSDAIAYRDHILGMSAALTNDGISYRAHVENKGWMPAVQNGWAAGSGQSLRIEGLQIWSPRAGVKVCYKGYVQNQGWEANEVCDGDVTGTTGQSKRLEAIKIRLASMPPGTHGVEYNAAVEGIGWQGVVRDGAQAGTTGQSRRIEAIAISLY